MLYASMVEITDYSLYQKPIFAFENHSTAVVAWARIRKKLDMTPWLLSLDDHADCGGAYSFAACDEEKRTWPNFNYDEYVMKRLNQIDIDSELSIIRGICDLRNDEHIDAAIKLGLLSFSVSITGDQFNASSKCGPTSDHDKGPFLYDEHSMKMYVVGPKDAYYADKSSPIWEKVIESSYLSPKMTDCVLPMAEAAKQQIDAPFILDIDLDYFCSKQAICPQDPSIFYWLIQRASAVTIACERMWVRQNRREEDLTSDYLLDRLLEHIRTAHARSPCLSV